MSMSVSFVKSTSKTNLKHNNRILSEKEKEKNPHIDESRSDENKYLIQEDIKDLYEEEFGEALENYNSNQKRSDRKINNYYEHINTSKKTSLQQEMIIQVGGKDDFSNEENREKANKVLEEWFDGFEKRNPNLKVYNAVIHNDEASPHLHLNFVPVASNYKRGLEKQVSFDRAVIQQDDLLNKTRPFADWREKEVNLLGDLLIERGIERKLVGTNQYKDVSDFKKKKDLEKEINILDENLSHKKNELLLLNEKVPAEMKIKFKREFKEVEIKSKNKNFIGISKTEIQKKDTGNIVLTEKTFKKIMSAARNNHELKTSTAKLLNTDPFIENKALIKENKELSDENLELKTVNHTLKDHISDLKLEIGNIYESTKEFFKEHTVDLVMFKDTFNAFVSKVKEKMPKSEIVNLHKRYKKQEVSYSMDRIKKLDELSRTKKPKAKNRGADMEL